MKKILNILSAVIFISISTIPRSSISSDSYSSNGSSNLVSRSFTVPTDQTTPHRYTQQPENLVLALPQAQTTVPYRIEQLPGGTVHITIILGAIPINYSGLLSVWNHYGLLTEYLTLEGSTAQPYHLSQIDIILVRHFFQHIRDLNLQNISLRWEDLLAIAERIPELRNLALRGSIITESPHATHLRLPQIQSLILDNTPLNTNGVLALLTRMPSVTTLSLIRIPLDISTYNLTFPRIHTLSLEGFRLRNHEFEALLRHFPNITHLNLANNQIDARAFMSLLRVSFRNNLIYLNLRNTGISRAVFNVFRPKHFKNLRILEI